MSGPVVRPFASEGTRRLRRELDRSRYLDAVTLQARRLLEDGAPLADALDVAFGLVPVREYGATGIDPNSEPSPAERRCVVVRLRACRDPRGGQRLETDDAARP